MSTTFFQTDLYNKKSKVNDSKLLFYEHYSILGKINLQKKKTKLSFNRCSILMILKSLACFSQITVLSQQKQNPNKYLGKL